MGNKTTKPPGYGMDTAHWEGKRTSLSNDVDYDMKSGSMKLNPEEAEWYWNNVSQFHTKMSEELKEFESKGFSLSDVDLVKNIEMKLNLLKESMKLQKPCAALIESITTDMAIIHKRQNFYTTKGKFYTMNRPHRKTVY